MENNEMSTKIDDLPLPQIEEQINEFKNDTSEVPEIKESEKFSLFDMIKKEINEENLYLLTLFLIIGLHNTSTYVSKIPYVTTYFDQDSWGFIGIKAFMFLLIFIIGKNYILPKIKI